MGGINQKADIIVNHILDERGRFILPKEFYKLMSEGFKDRYDPRRLSFALAVTTGLRSKDAISARLAWFSKDFSMMQMSQCKPKITKKDGKLHLKTQPRFVPLPEWLSTDLRNYCQYRIMMGIYVGENLEDFRLFPKLKESVINKYFCTLRNQCADKFPFLKDIWRIEKYYNNEGNLLRQKKFYRIASHCARSFYCSSAWEVTNKDLKATQVISGHQRIESLSRYLKVFGLKEKKEEIKNRFMNPLCSEQKIPISADQRRLEEFDTTS